MESRERIEQTLMGTTERAAIAKEEMALTLRVCEPIKT